MKMIATLRAFVVLGLVLAVTGCASNQPVELGPSAVSEPLSIPAYDKAELADRTEDAWQHRADQKQLLVAIELYQQQLAGLDASETVRAISINTRLAHAYFLMADTHVRLLPKSRARHAEMLVLFQKGADAARAAVQLVDPELGAKLGEHPRHWHEHVEGADDRALVPLFWYAVNLGRWSAERGVGALMKTRPALSTAFSELEHRAPKPMVSSVRAALGVFHATIPVGSGDPDRCKASFERSLDLAPNRFMTRVWFAESYAVLVQDEGLFERELQVVIETPADVVPELEQENLLAKRRAEQLLARRAELFY